MKITLFIICSNFTTICAILSKIADMLPDSLNPLNVIFKNECVTDLGCFYTGSPFFHAFHRPISLSPTTDLGTKFQLFTPSNPDDKCDLEATVKSIKKSPFNSRWPTKILIHGFASDLNLNDFRYVMKKAILQEGRYNVIIVDWTADNGMPYSQAVANTRTTGALVAKLINLLINSTRAKAEDFHLIGHSLGAHLAGYAGERIPKLGRITGLDPAGLYFQMDENSVRLDPSDALFVDVIHTNAAESFITGLGIRDPLGHIDFYPNGGRSQPGCDIASRTTGAIFGREKNSSTKLLPSACDHERVNELFTESVNRTRCRFMAVLCDSNDDYENEKCTSKKSRVVEMGFHAKFIRGLDIPSKFFLKTNDVYPFCIKDELYT